MLSSSGILNVITKPTRVASSSSSLNDHILTRNTYNTIHPGVNQTDMLSDHFPLFCTTSKANCVITSPNKITYKPSMYRDYTKLSVELLKDEVKNNLYDFMNNKISCPDCSN